MNSKRAASMSVTHRLEDGDPHYSIPGEGEVAWTKCPVTYSVSMDPVHAKSGVRCKLAIGGLKINPPHAIAVDDVGQHEIHDRLFEFVVTPDHTVGIMLFQKFENSLVRVHVEPEKDQGCVAICTDEGVYETTTAPVICAKEKARFFVRNPLDYIPAGLKMVTKTRRIKQKTAKRKSAKRDNQLAELGASKMVTEETSNGKTITTIENTEPCHTTMAFAMNESDCNRLVELSAGIGKPTYYLVVLGLTPHHESVKLCLQTAYHIGSIPSADLLHNDIVTVDARGSVTRAIVPRLTRGIASSGLNVERQVQERISKIEIGTVLQGVLGTLQYHVKLVAIPPSEEVEETPSETSSDDESLGDDDTVVEEIDIVEGV